MKSLERLARARSEERHPYLILDPRYEKLRDDCAVLSQPVLAASGITSAQHAGAAMARRESASSWEELLGSLKHVH
jgi:transposase-like protein